jgi:hypothetical protein
MYSEKWMDLKKDFVNKILEKDKGDEWVKKW